VSVEKAFEVPSIVINDLGGILSGTADPSSPGLNAPVGSLYMRDNGGIGEHWIKFDAADTDWKREQNDVAITGLGVWRYRTETAPPPSSGQIRFDDADISAATEFYLHETNDNGDDVSTFINLLMVAGSVVYIQDRTDASKFVIIELGTFVDDGVFRTFQIANILEGSGGEPSQNTQVTLVVSGNAGAGGGNVTKVGTPAEFEIGVWTGDGTLGRSDLFTYGENAEQLKIAVDLNTINDVGLFLLDPDSSLNPDGWQLMPGQAGLHDGNLILTDKPSDAINNRKWTVLPGATGTTVFGGGGAATPNSAGFKSETLGALAFYIPLQTSGVDKGWISCVGETGTGKEGRFQFDVYAFGDTGLQLTAGIISMVVDADYRAHVDFDAALLFLNAASIQAGETGITRNTVDGLQLQGSGSTADVTLFNDLHEAVVQVLPGTKNVDFAGNIRLDGTDEWNKGVDIASAATLVLGSDGNSFVVNGTTDIDAISAKPIGTVIILDFDDVLSLNHDAVALILQGNVDMVTEAGNTVGLYSYDGTNWREIFRNDGQQVRVSGTIADQSMVRGNGGQKRIQDTGNFIGDDDEMVLAGTVILQNFTDAQLNDNGNSVNTNDGKAAGAMVFNSTQGHAVTAQGSGSGDVWNDGVGTTTNTPV